MNRLIGAALVGAFVAGLAIADEKPGVPKELQGEWSVGAAITPSGTMTSSKGLSTLTFAEGKAEWTEIKSKNEDVVTYHMKGGKGTFKIDATAKPPTIELTSGKLVYKGIYKHGMNDKKIDTNVLIIRFSEEGGDFPKEFLDGSPFAPPGFKGVSLVMERKKK